MTALSHTGSHAGTAAAGRPATGDLGLAFRLARRELRGGLRGFRIFLACLTLGVAAIALVGTVSDAMLTGLRNDGRALLGGDLDLRHVHRAATERQRAWLARRGDLSESVEMRAMARALPAAQSSEGGAEGERPPRALVELKAVDSLYPLYGEVRLDPPLPLDQALARGEGGGAWGAVVDRGLLNRLGVELGDRVRVGEADYEIRAVLEFEPDRATRTFTLGPTFMVARGSLEATGLVQPGSLIRYHYRLRLAPGETIEGVRGDLAETFPKAGWRVRDATDAAPRIDRLIDQLTLFLTLVGLTALLVGGVGVGNAVRAFLEGRTATIATLKCLGASGRLIFQVYMIQILALAAVGIALGLAIGVAGPFAVDLVIGQALGWRAAAGVYPQPLALAALFGLLTTVTFSLWPLLRAQRIAPASLFRDLVTPAGGGAGPRAWALVGGFALALGGLAVATASDRLLALYFVAGAAGALVLFRVTAAGIMALARRLPRPRRPGLRLAVANLHRPGAPTGSIVTSLGLGITVLVAIALVEGNMARQVEQSLPERAPSFYFIDIQPDQVAAFEETVRAVPGMEELRRVPMLRGRIVAINGVPPEQLEIPPDVGWVFRGDRGLTWSAEPPPGTELTAGEWWPADYQGPPLVSFSDEVGRALGLGPGDRVTVDVLGRDVELTIANLRRIDWSELTINFLMVVSPGLLEAVPQTHLATVKMAPGQEDALEAAVTERFSNVSSIRVKEALDQFAQLMGHIATAVRAIAAVALLAGVLVLAGAVAAGHHRRVYDAVVLKVLGATRRLIGQTFLIEYGLLGLLTAAIAAVLGSVAAYGVLTAVMQVEFVFLPATVVATAALAAVITLALGFAGTWRALGQKAAPLLRNE